MSRSTSPTSIPVDLLLACVQCARSKAKCDRKVPCSRCKLKKLVCQIRFTQRGQGRLSANPKSQVPLAIATNKNSDAVAPESVTSVTTNQDPTTVVPQKYPKGNGFYIDWSHSIAHNWISDRSSSTLEAEQVEDSFARLAAAAPRGYESYPSSPFASSHLMQSEMLSTATDVNLMVPTQGPSPITQLPDLSGMSPWNLAFNISPGLLESSTNDDGDNIMDDYLLTPSNLPEDGQLHMLEGWPLFQCNSITSSSASSPTSANHVKNLESLLSGGNIPIQISHAIEPSTVVESLLASTRDKLTAALQWLFTEAQEVYRLRGQNDEISSRVGPSLVVLHPLSVLDSLLKAYFTSWGRDVIWPSIRLILMIAGGGMTTGMGDICVQLAHGLLEICRISLRNLIEQNLILALDYEISQCALLNILVSVWSGDKWQMTTAYNQKSMFLEMHLKAKQHNNRQAQIARLKALDDVAKSWGIWKEQERSNRTTHAWLILDHEMCLFQDTPSISFLSSASLDTPIPSPDTAWQAHSAKHWMEQMPSSVQGVTLPPSLGEWIGCFSETNHLSTTAHLSPITLRLLLCHLQNQVNQLRITMDTVAGGSTRKGSQHMPIVLLSVQAQGVQELLDKWYKLAKAQKPDEIATLANTSNMMLYHLIMLNVISSFPEIEHLARNDRPLGGATHPSKTSHTKHSHHLENPQQIYFHCGQVLRHVRAIPEPARPPWWAGAVYRVALIAWANSMACAAEDDAPIRTNINTQAMVALDVLSPDHATVLGYLNHEGGIPVFADLNGLTVLLDNPVNILQQLARFLDTDIKTKFTSGIQQKLLTMAHRWNSATPQTLSSAM